MILLSLIIPVSVHCIYLTEILIRRRNKLIILITRRNFSALFLLYFFFSQTGVDILSQVVEFLLNGVEAFVDFNIVFFNSFLGFMGSNVFTFL